MTNNYGDTGASYLAAFGLLQLGLPPDDAFWTSPSENCTQSKIWQEELDVGLDEAHDGTVCTNA